MEENGSMGWRRTGVGDGGEWEYGVEEEEEEVEERRNRCSL